MVPGSSKHSGMKPIANLILLLIALLAAPDSVLAKSATTPVLGAGAFSQTFTFTTATNYPASPGSTITLSGSRTNFSSLSFQLLSSSGIALTSPASNSIFTATRSGSNYVARFNDGNNANINFTANTNYLILVSGIANLNNVQYSLSANYLKPGSPFVQVTPAVPEPATYAMLLVGFALIGATMMRRRREQAQPCFA